MRHAIAGVSFALSATLSAFAVWTVISRSVQASEYAPVGLPFDFASNVAKWSADLTSDRDHTRVALIGDSTLMAAVPGAQSLPAGVQAALRLRGSVYRKLAVHSVCSPGVGPSALYFMADSIARARPDAIVVELNLRALNDFHPKTFGYPELAGWLPARSLVDTLGMPMSAVGLTADRVLWYQLLVRLSFAQRWRALRDLQVRTFKAREAAFQGVETWFQLHGYHDLQFELGIARLVHAQVPGRSRMSAELARKNLGPALSGAAAQHPELVFLQRALERFRQAGIPSLVYVTPANVEHARSVGVSDAGVERTIGRVREVVQGAGAHFVDFHRLFPDAAFRDPGDHYTYQGAPNGTRWLADRVAHAIVTQLYGDDRALH